MCTGEIALTAMNHIVTMYKGRVQLHASADLFHLEKTPPVTKMQISPLALYEGI